METKKSIIKTLQSMHQDGSYIWVTDALSYVVEFGVNAGHLHNLLTGFTSSLLWDILEDATYLLPNIDANDTYGYKKITLACMDILKKRMRIKG